MQQGGRAAAGGDRVDGVARAPDDEAPNTQVSQVVRRDALDAVAEQRPEGAVGPLDAKRPLELLEQPMRERRRARPGVPDDPAYEPVRARGESEERRVPRRKKQVREPAGPAARERIAVDQNDPARGGGVGERRADRHRGAERMTDQDRSREVHLAREVEYELAPVRQRVGPSPLRVPERRQVEREHAMRSPERAADAMPDPARLREPAQQHDRRAAVAPTAVRENGVVDAHEGTAVQRGCVLDAALRRRVVDEGCARGDDDEHEQSDAEGARRPPHPPMQCSRRLRPNRSMRRS